MGEFDSPVRRTFICKHDLVLVTIAGKPGFFARVETIVADKPGWWTVGFTRIGVPCQKFTWTLDDNHMNCEEFSMRQIPHKMEIIETDEPPEATAITKTHVAKTFKPGRKVIPMKPEFAQYCPAEEPEPIPEYIEGGTAI